MNFLKRKDPKIITNQLFQERFPTANCCFLAGSVMRGEGTEYSDLDIVVLFDSLENAYRESFIYEGWPIEILAHDMDTLRYFFDDDRKSGCPSLQNMVSEGEVIPGKTDLSKMAKKLAKDDLAKGPDEISASEMENRRYNITDLVDDLRAPKTFEEAVITASQLYIRLADFYFRANGLWSASGKTIPRNLKKVDEQFYQKISSAFGFFYKEQDQSGIIKISEELLTPYGGFLFDGFKSDAPKEWKIKAKS